MTTIPKRKADPYGSHIPSPIPAPAKPGTEIVPAYNPPGIPAYLAPIPLNTRNIAAELQQHIMAREKRLMRWLYSTWEAEARAIKDQEIRNAIRDGEIPPGWIERWQQRYALYVDKVWAPEVLRAMGKAATIITGGMDSAGLTRLIWEVQDERIRQWIGVRGTELAVNLTQEQHRAMRAIIRHLGFEQGMGPEELGRYLRPVIGLTYREEEAILKFREALWKQKLHPRAIEHRTQNYASWLRRRRGQRIAVTELAFGFNYGGFEAVRQAVDQGIVLAGRVRKTWSTAKDERTCPFCGPMDGKTVDLEQTFPGATKRLPNIYVPPAHPLCRCSVIYEVLHEATTAGKAMIDSLNRVADLLQVMVSAVPGPDEVSATSKGVSVWN